MPPALPYENPAIMHVYTFRTPELFNSQDLKLPP